MTQKFKIRYLHNLLGLVHSYKQPFSQNIKGLAVDPSESILDWEISHLKKHGGHNASCIHPEELKRTVLGLLGGPWCGELWEILQLPPPYRQRLNKWPRRDFYRIRTFPIDIFSLSLYRLILIYWGDVTPPLHNNLNPNRVSPKLNLWFVTQCNRMVRNRYIWHPQNYIKF